MPDDERTETTQQPEPEEPKPPQVKTKIRRWGTVDKVEDPEAGPVKVRQFGSGIYQTKVIRPAPPPTEPEPPPPAKGKAKGD